MSLQVTSIYPFPELLGTFGKEASYGCLCGSGKVIIKADGGIVPCDVADYPADYLAQGFEIPRIPGYSIQEAYESELFKRYRDATTRFGRPECERCEYTDMCHSSCRTLAFKETGSLLNRGSLCFKANPG
jgi:radical SAM protein with 4Fe4S-binding SPASM domain